MRVFKYAYRNLNRTHYVNQCSYEIGHVGSYIKRSYESPNITQLYGLYGRNVTLNRLINPSGKLGT